MAEIFGVQNRAARFNRGRDDQGIVPEKTMARTDVEGIAEQSHGGLDREQRPEYRACSVVKGTANFFRATFRNS